MKSFVIKPLSIALLAATLAACSTNAPAPSASAAKAAEAALNNDDWYQVWTEGQAVVFDDHAVYAEYVKTGKAPVMKDLGIKDQQTQQLPGLSQQSHLSMDTLQALHAAPGLP